jgi:L-lactate dehydrogenase
MKVAIIGGGGRVGSCAAFALQCSGIVRELVLLDANQATAEGEALDLLHGAAYCADQKISAGTYADCKDADIICITAGLRRKPDESRLDLINRNVTLFLGILESLKAAGMKKDAIVFVVSNPVDILTQLAVEKTGFCSLIASSLDLPATQVRAMILGEHGDTMLPVWSSASVDGFPLTKFPGVTPAFQTQIFERTQKSGAEVISRKGGAGYAVGVAIREVIDCIALDRRLILPVSSQINGAYGIRGVSISVPTVVGRAGALKHIELELWPKEIQALQASAQALKNTRAKTS